MYKITFKNANLGTLELQHLPLNINDIKSHFLRSEKFYGVLRQIEDVSFIWIKEAADYIRNVVNAYGVQSIIEVSMQYTDNNIDYEQFYTGILDLKAFTDNTIEIECRVISSSAESKYLNNIETQYKLYLPSILNIRERVNAYDCTFNALTEYPNLTGAIVSVAEKYSNPNIVLRRRDIAIFDTVRNFGDAEKYNSNVIRDTYEIRYIAGLVDYEQIYLNSIYTCLSDRAEVSVLLGAGANFRVNIYRAETLAMSGNARLLIDAIVFNQDQTVKSITTVGRTAWFSLGSGDGGTTPIHTAVIFNSVLDPIFAIRVDVENGDKLGYYIRAEHQPVDPDDADVEIDFKYYTTSSFIVQSNEYAEDTQHRCLAAKRAFERLIDSTQTNQSSTIDPTTTYVESELLTSERYLPTVVTSGLELRKALTSGVDGEMVTSIADLWESLNTPFCLGMGLRKQGDSIRVKIDHRSEFFKPTIVYDLGEVTEFKTEFDETYVRNVLNIVYPGVDNSDFPNGIYEYLTKYGYTLPSNYVDNSLEISCPYKVDATSVEKVRTNSTSETQDSVQDDESNFLIRCYIDGSTYYNSRGEEFDSISQTGLQNNTQLFNVDMFAPVAMRFWAWWILGGLKYYPSTDELVMQRNYPNADVSITVDGIVCDTNNISISKLKQLAAIQDYTDAKGDLFEPFAYTFKAPVSVNFINVFNNERHGVLKFSYKNKDYYGFGMKVPALPKKSGEFRLLKLSKRGESLCV